MRSLSAGKDGARGAKVGIAPWRGAGANDDQVRIKLVDVELNGADSMPLESIEYSQWCLQNPRGTKAGCVVS